jgi:hypothetical protein
MGVFGFLTLVGCGGGGGDGGGDGTAPSSPSVSVGFSLKQLQFSWNAAGGATSYRLLQDPDGASGFSQVGSDLASTATSTNLDIGVHRHNWAAARYALDACNSAGCTRSNEVTITAGMLAAIGYFKASNTGLGDQFGQSVALSGDGNTLAVGATVEASNATDIDGNQGNDLAFASGAVYVFTRASGVWSQQAYIKASNTGAGDQFGNSVALSADGDTLAVGAVNEDSSGTGLSGDENDNSSEDSGAVYVFVRTGTDWSQQAYIKASNTQMLTQFTLPNDQFGISLALSADGNTLAVGAYAEDSSDTGVGANQNDNAANDAGAVYVFARTSGVWTQQAYLKASNTGAGDNFGWSVGLSSDGNTLAVGAIGEDSDATGIDGNQAGNTADNAGAVYVFTRTGTAWSQQAYVKASNTALADNFGHSVALSGDGNTLAVSALAEDSAATGIDGDQADNSASDAGAVYVFAHSGGMWSQQAYVKASNTELADRFGRSVALNGDGNTLAVGARFEASNATGIGGNQASNSAAQAGAVYIYTRTGGTWSAQVTYVKASNTGAADSFGWSVALSGDGNTLAAGANGEASSATGIGGNQTDNSLASAGAVYLY